MIVDVPDVPDIRARINGELPPEIRLWGFVCPLNFSAIHIILIAIVFTGTDPELLQRTNVSNRCVNRFVSQNNLFQVLATAENTPTSSHHISSFLPSLTATCNESSARPWHPTSPQHHLLIPFGQPMMLVPQPRTTILSAKGSGD
jgi:hypothetical protein